MGIARAARIDKPVLGCWLGDSNAAAVESMISKPVFRSIRRPTMPSARSAICLRAERRAWLSPIVPSKHATGRMTEPMREKSLRPRAPTIARR